MSDMKNEVASKGKNDLKCTHKKMGMKDPGQEILLERKNERKDERKDEINDPMKRLILERQTKKKMRHKRKERQEQKETKNIMREKDLVLKNKKYLP